MKRLICVVFLLFIIFVLVTRFVYVQNDVALGPPPGVDCVTDEGAGQGEFSCLALEQINGEYLSTIKPIFAVKCLMCHGVPDKVPLYAKIPPASLLVRGDMKEAKEDINMSWDFPFVDSKGPKHTFKQLREVVEENEMPPLDYKIMHWQSGLTAPEKEKILNWVRSSEAKLGIIEN